MAKERELRPVTIENCRITFRNFSGAEGRFNAKGDRNFNVLIDDELAEIMAKDGWKIKWMQPREEGDSAQARLEVAVKYGKGRPPRVVMITSRGKTNLSEDNIEVLDWAVITHVDMIIRPYEWEVGGRTGIKAYLSSIYVTIQEDELELKYLDVPDSANGSLALDEFTSAVGS